MQSDFFIVVCSAVSPLTRDIPKAEIEAAIAEVEACEQAEAEEVAPVPEIEVIVPEIEVPQAESCADSAAVEDDAYPAGFDAENIIF